MNESGKNFGLALLRALGIDSQGVVSIHLDVTLDFPPRITIERFCGALDITCFDDDGFKKWAPAKERIELELD